MPIVISRNRSLFVGPGAASAHLGWQRREFLQALGASAALGSLSGFTPLRAMNMPRGQKAVVVTFGGGARDEETFAPEGQENIPCMLKQLIPQGTFYTQVINRGILGHYVATASLATGTYETWDNFALVPPSHPTVFEYFRRDLHRPATDAWVIAPSNGFNRIGCSDNRSFGPNLGAEVLLPKHLLAAAMQGHSSADFEHLLSDNYESPIAVPTAPSSSEDIHRTAELLKLSFDDFRTHAVSLASPDELSVYIARRLMKQLSPSLLWITLHDIDIAHSGAYSLYIDGIRRSDRLCGDLWQAIQSDTEYAGRTTMFILPDFGRDSDLDAGGNGFQHHRTGDALSRTTWMIVLGPGVRQNAIVDRPVDSLDLVPTLGAVLGFMPSLAKGQRLHEVL
jgi:hypothetical protein